MTPEARHPSLVGPGLGEMTDEEVGGSIRYGVGVDAEEPVISSFDPLDLARNTDCLQRLV